MLYNSSARAETAGGEKGFPFLFFYIFLFFPRLVCWFPLVFSGLLF